MVEVKEYTIGDIKNLLDQSSFWESKILPITRQRALSQTNNPRTNEDDIALLTASEDNELVSYLGLLPDYLYIDGVPVRMAWGTTAWVNPEKKNTWAYGILLIRALELYNNRFAISSFTESAKRAFDKSRKFTVLRELKGIRLFFVSEYHNHPSMRKPIFKNLSFLIVLLDSILNSLLRLRLFICKRFVKMKGVRYQRIDHIDRDLSAFIDKFNVNDLTRKGAAEFNWILSFPWILPRQEADDQEEKYYFSSFSDNFDLFGVKVSSEIGKLIGFLVVKVIDGHIYIPYLFCDADDVKYILRVIRDLLFQYNAGKLTLFNDKLNEQLNTVWFPYFRKRSVVQVSYITKKCVDVNLDTFFLHEGDGDNVFT